MLMETKKTQGNGNGPEGQRLQDYLTRTRERNAELAPYLARIDMEALSKVEEAYQREMHAQIYGLRHGDGDAIMDAVGLIRGAQGLLLWTKAQKERTEQ